MSDSYVAQFLQEVLRIGFSLLVIVILLVVGWYIMWKVYLSRYEVFRELVGVKKEKKPKAPRRRQMLDSESTQHQE